jgi:hypothetical protein
MPERTALFVAAMVEIFGKRAYAVALEQVRRASANGPNDIATSWAMIADGIAALPITVVPTGLHD